MLRKKGGNAWMVATSNAELARLSPAVVVDAADGSVIEERPAVRPGGLLGALMVRAGALQPLPKAAPKRPRGRPSKVHVVATAARIWDEVTEGNGVVLVDGVPVEVPKALK